MVQKADLISKSELRFFRELSTANAHEIKNALAVINENAGLLDDLVVTAGKGRPPDLTRVKRIANAIREQVARADHIARSTSWFSDCVDKGQTATDIDQCLRLLADMATRYANLRDVNLRIKPSNQNISVSARPFAVLQLLWVCLFESMKTCRKGQVLTVQTRKAAASVEIEYGPFFGRKKTIAETLQTDSEMAALLGAMGGAIRMDPEASTLTLTIANRKNLH